MAILATILAGNSKQVELQHGIRTMNPAEVFRDNLRRFSEQLGFFTPQELARGLGYKLNELRWLKRLWQRGLKRPDARKKKHLMQLAALFGVKPEDLWRPEIEVEEADIVHDPQRWGEFARAVIETYCQFQHMKQHSRNAAIHALYRYDFDEARLVADIVANGLGLDRPLLARLDLSPLNIVKKGDPEWNVLTNDIREQNALIDYVIEKSKDHEWFLPYQADLKMKFGAQADRHFKKMLLDIQRRPRSPVEILEEFRASCLDSFTEDDGFDVAIREISVYLKDMWRIAIEKNDSIDPKEFAKYINNQLSRVDSP